MGLDRRTSVSGGFQMDRWSAIDWVSAQAVALQ